MIWSAIDLLICSLLLVLALASLFASTLQQRVIFFIAFGLMTAIIWARLQAPDLALAEAIIGAGLTGAMLLMALRQYANLKQGKHREHREHREHRGRLVAQALMLLLTLGLMAVVAALFPISNGAPGYAVEQRLSQSGVSHPVTAVLLNFRSWDTLLELAVLLSAALGILNLGPARQIQGHSVALTDALARVLVPLLVLTAGYLLWTGAFAPGGAFQAGAVLASAAVVIHLTGRARLMRPDLAVLRLLLVVGLLLFVVIGLWPMIGGAAFLQYPQALAGALILVIEAAAMVSIAAMLTLVYLGGHPHSHWPVAAVRVSEPLPERR
ncbi:hydrogenase subunit MbhD domain-containing protein [Motiliproteus sp.]|uniref:hydrogenase subunit MbhD domain-containing protein n=1 Tax=Motiliproteus sp. TaxID=1898955 RepID=UPI003BAA7FF2